MPAASPPPLVSVENVTLRLGGVTVFSGLHLCLHKGEHLALLGPNGAGKTTLLRLLQAELRPAQLSSPSPASSGAAAFSAASSPVREEGRMAWGFEGVPDTSALSARTHVRLVSPGQQRNYVRQGWNISGEEIILSGLDNAVMVYGEVDARHYEAAVRLAEEANASHLLGVQAPAMSQGQLRLVLLLRALMSAPGLLLLDEPFDGLDAVAREDITRCIALAARRGSTVLLTAHRPEDIPGFIREALVLRNGTLSRHSVGALPQLFIQAEHTHNETVFADRGTYGDTRPSAREHAASPAATAAEPPLLRLAHVDVFIERRQVLFDINWVVWPGEQWLVSGRNGAGKSTLLRLLYGEEFAAYGGEVLWRGRERPPLEELRAQVGYVSDRLQDAYDYDLHAEDVVISGLRGSIGLYHEPGEDERALARVWLERLGVGHVAGVPFHSLSSGTARRVLLARALAGAPPVLLLDEPCSGLDPESRALFLAALPHLAARGVSIIHVTHHAGDRSELFTHELILEDGRVVSEGPRDAFGAQQGS